MANEQTQSGLVTARDRARLAYRVVKGTGSGRVALVHSLAMNGAFWDRVTPLLAGHADVLVYDCRGHGASDKPAGPYTIDLFADDLADLLDHVGWETAVVCGASMGGCVALAFAERHSARVAGLGLFDTTAWYGEDARGAWEERAQKALDGGMSALVGFQKTRWFSDSFREANPEIVEAAIGVFVKNDLQPYAETCRMLGAVDKRSALPAFGFPCRIVVGEEDYATPVAMSQALKDAIPNARMRVIERARHFTPLEVPQEIASEIEALLSAH
ncbi:alpha/beta fold hydrolase [Lutibaculum baratangense]|uniref:Beta-ketoadipate enol-lactone hydrolase n=1 Tax=Lutibaculum baratangense AMV1 TaxID=631454 RepID=V4RJ83_9HYPH|nr:alpha/beta fold hydrolase [Lutibaculum baratangense]ESR26151.1 Beta-ketoadipate enol-lactone hydrolase [Lutibaculum baratangense AMV1]